jgi:hypothetical protein
MSGKDKSPDKVTHDSYGVVPGTGDLGGTIHETTIHKGKDTYTGYGSSRGQSDKRAGDKYSSGKKDK